MAELNISVGKIGKPHGLSGAFRFLLTEELKSNKKLPKYFLLERNGSYLPFFIKKIEWLGFNEGLIEFEEISSLEQAKQFTRKELFLTEKDYKLLFKKNTDELDYLIGYKAKEEKEELGIISEIIENPGQILCSVKRGDKEFYIPLVEEFILKIDKRKKEIIFDLPEGLLDL